MAWSTGAWAVGRDARGYVSDYKPAAADLYRVNTKTGKMDEYQLPRYTNVRRIFVDDSQAKPSLWIGNNHGASIVKVEPLE